MKQRQSKTATNKPWIKTLLVLGLGQLVISCGSDMQTVNRKRSSSKSDWQLRDSELRGQIEDQADASPRQDHNQDQNNQGQPAPSHEESQSDQTQPQHEPVAEEATGTDQNPSGHQQSSPETSDTAQSPSTHEESGQETAEADQAAPAHEETFQEATDKDQETTEHQDLAQDSTSATEGSQPSTGVDSNPSPYAYRPEICNGKYDNDNCVVDEGVKNSCGSYGPELDLDSDGIADCKQKKISYFQSGPESQRIDLAVVLIKAGENRQSLQESAQIKVDSLFADPAIAVYKNYFNINFYWYDNNLTTVSDPCKVSIFSEWQNCFATKMLPSSERDIVVVVSGSDSNDELSTSAGSTFTSLSESPADLLAKFKTALSYLRRGTPSSIGDLSSATATDVKLGIYELSGPIDQVSPPKDEVVLVDGQTKTFSVKTKAPAGIVLQINWYLDDEELSELKGADSLTLAAADLSLGAHKLTVKVRDPSTSVGLDPYGRLEQQRQWLVQVGSPETTDGSMLYTNLDTKLQLRIEDSMTSRAQVSRAVLEVDGEPELQISTEFEKYLFLPFMIANGDAKIIEHLRLNAGELTEVKRTYVNNKYESMNYLKTYEPALMRFRFPAKIGQTWSQLNIKEHIILASGETLDQTYHRSAKVIEEALIQTVNGEINCHVIQVTKTMITANKSFGKTHYECWHPTLGLVHESESWSKDSGSKDQKTMIRIETK